MYHFIYKTKNEVNNKIYIGMHSAEVLDDRYLGSGWALKAAIKKYGRKNFSREILCHLDSREDAYAMEELVVDEEFMKLDSNYNLQTGGKRSFKVSDDTKKRQSVSRKNMTHTYECTDAHRKNISDAHLGKVKTKEHLANTAKSRSRACTMYGIDYPSRKAAAYALGIPFGTVSYRLRTPKHTECIDRGKIVSH